MIAYKVFSPQTTLEAEEDRSNVVQVGFPQKPPGTALAPCRTEAAQGTRALAKT